MADYGLPTPDLQVELFDDDDRSFDADSFFGQQPVQLVDAAHFLSSQPDDDVALTQPRP